MTDPTTRPMPAQQPGMRDQAPPALTECPRCGGVTLTRRGVTLHDDEHAKRDRDARRQEVLLTRLERLLDSIETNVDEQTGERLTLAQWIEQTDDLLDEHEALIGEQGTLTRALRDVQAAIAEGAFAHSPLTLEPWPGDPGTTDEPDDDGTDLAAKLEAHAGSDEQVATGSDGSPVDEPGADEQPLISVGDPHAFAEFDDDDDDPHAVSIPGARF